MKQHILVLCLISIICAYGTIINVPGDYPTVQQGLNAASSGDTVLVGSGTYPENIFWPLLNGIKLFSELGSDSTIIDGGSSSCVIYFSGLAVIDTTTVIRGFTIRNGGAVVYGGGVCLIHSSPKIETNVIENNSSSYGSGICCSDSSSPTIAGNTIINNSAAEVGGGIYCKEYSNPTIAANMISGNSADNGSGIYCRQSNPMISGNYIISNAGSGIYTHYATAIINGNNNISNNTGGGLRCYGLSPTISGNHITNNPDYGIYCFYCDPTISGNQITDNPGKGIHCVGADPTINGNYINGNSGSGIYCYDMSYPMISSNIISGNSADNGGGISCVTSSSPIISNNRITGNSASQNGGGIYCSNSCDPQIRCNTVNGNSANNMGGGICCEVNSFPVIDSNNIYNNRYGAYNADNSQMLIAEYNWWGDSTGPYHPGLNPNGLGDSTNMFVDPVPFLTDSIPGIGVYEGTISQKPLVSIVEQNHPNPFKRVTLIRYHSFEPSRVTIKVYNPLGQEVATLVDGLVTPGEHIVRWDARGLSEGIYFYRAIIGNFTETRKCLLMK